MNPAMTITHRLPLPCFSFFEGTSAVFDKAMEPGWAHISTQEDALQVLQSAADRDPRNYPVGIALNSVLAGRGRMICWFESWAGLWSALRHVVTPLASTRPDQAFRFKWWLARMSAAPCDTRPDLNLLRRTFAPALRIEWLGTFAELRAAEGEFARQTVESFLQMEMPPAPVEIEVPACYLESFIAYLRQTR